MADAENARTPLKSKHGESTGTAGKYDDEGAKDTESLLNNALADAEEPDLCCALILTIISVALAFAYCGVVYHYYGETVAIQYLSAYLIEQSLSIDNLFVFYLIFKYYKTPQKCQTKVLFVGWGIALLLRGAMIFAVGTSISKLKYVLLFFAVILLWQAVMTMFAGDDDDDDLSDNVIVKWAQKCFTVSDNYHGNDFFFTTEAGVRMATPLVVVMFTTELSDVAFAVDSVPAVFGVTDNMMVAYSSNMFALLSLRSMYVVLAQVVVNLPGINITVGFILLFVAVKIILGFIYDEDIPGNSVSLLIIVGMLCVGISSSLISKHCCQGKQWAGEIRKAGDDAAADQGRGGGGGGRGGKHSPIEKPQGNGVGVAGEAELMHTPKGEHKSNGDGTEDLHNEL